MFLMVLQLSIFFLFKILNLFCSCRVPNTSIGLCGEQERWEEQRLSHGDREDPIQRLKLNENVSWLLYIPDNYSQTVIFVYNFFMIQTDKHTKDSICLWADECHFTQYNNDSIFFLDINFMFWYSGCESFWLIGSTKYLWGILPNSSISVI